jgi:hypothetical protein
MITQPTRASRSFELGTNSKFSVHQLVQQQEIGQRADGVIKYPETQRKSQYPPGPKSWQTSLPNEISMLSGFGEGWKLPKVVQTGLEWCRPAATGPQTGTIPLNKISNPAIWQH